MSIQFRSWINLCWIATALLLCASCSSSTPPPAAVDVKPKEWSPNDAEAPRPMPAIEKPELSIAPPTQPAAPTTRDDVSLTNTPPPPPVAQRHEKERPKDLPDQPGPDNTGVADQKHLKISQKIVATNGQVIENLFITGGILANDTSDVVIRNCVIDAAAHEALRCLRAKNLLIEHCDLYNMKDAGIMGENFHARWNNVYDCGGDGFKPGDGSVVESNWVHQMGFNDPTAHSDGAQIRGGTNIKVIGNYFDMPINEPGMKSNSSLFIQGIAGRKGTNDILVEHNWCRGGNFTIHAYSDGGNPSSIRIIGNRFFRGQSRYGEGNIEPGVVWKDNVFDEDESPAMPTPPKPKSPPKQ